MRRVNVSGKIGRAGEVAVARWLRNRGVAALLQPRFGAPYDIDCSGVRVEVKTANPRETFNQHDWTFATHCRGYINEKCDIFIFRLHDVPNRGHVHLVVPAPLTQLGITISERSLANKWLPYMDNLEPLQKAIEQKRTA